MRKLFSAVPVIGGDQLIVSDCEIGSICLRATVTTATTLNAPTSTVGSTTVVTTRVCSSSGRS